LIKLVIVTYYVINVKRDYLGIVGRGVIGNTMRAIACENAAGWH
jgi:hypothetical protein